MKIRRMIFSVMFLGLFFPPLVFIANAGNDYDLLAQNFLKYVNCDKEILAEQIIEANALDKALAKVPVAYLVKLKNNGFILISTTRELTPVKAYSTHGDFDTLPAPFRHYLLLEMEYNYRQAAVSGATMKKTTLSDTGSRWDFLLNYSRTRTTSAYEPDTYLLKTTWNQDYPYNKYLPEIDGKNVVAGCVSVAMSQLMKYHGYPETAEGIYSYEWNNQQLKTIVNRPINWDNMPDSLAGSESECQIDEVAKLIRNLGIMNETEFSLDNSGASSNCTGFIRSFGYAKDILRMNTADTAFFDTLRAEIDAERPVLLSFPGHMTVADGYASDGSGRKIHINMGWGGHDNDYYYLDAPVQAGGYTFEPDLEMLYNIKPCNNGDCTANLEENDGVAGTQITGKFDFQYDVDEYALYLEGATNISGKRTGYAGQPFFISVYDSHNKKLFSIDEPIETNLEAGKYRIRVSLESESGSRYVYDDKDEYTVTITTDPVSPAEKAAIDEALDIPPVIYNEFKTILLNTGDQTPYCILIDARDENGDVLAISIDNTNSGAVAAVLNGNILSITPVVDAIGKSAKITVTATANGKTAERSFVVMVSDQDVAFGKAFEVSGTFENPDDFDLHKVILDGQCTISGDRGYSNQAFFTSVLDVDETTIIPAGDQAISHNFSRNFYFIGASPTGDGSVYNLDDSHNNYVVRVSCPDADDSDETMATLFGIDLSGTQAPTDLVIDVNNDQVMDLADAILLLQVLSGIEPSETLVLSEDLDNDGQVDLRYVLYIIETLVGLR